MKSSNNLYSETYSLTSSRNSSLSFFIYASLIQFFCPYVFAIRFLNLRVKLCGMHESPCDKRGKIATRVEIQFEHYCFPIRTWIWIYSDSNSNVNSKQSLAISNHWKLKFESNFERVFWLVYLIRPCWIGMLNLANLTCTLFFRNWIAEPLERIDRRWGEGE